MCEWVKCVKKQNSIVFHQMSVMPTLMAVCMEEPAATSSMVIPATAACMMVTIVRSYQTSVLCLPIFVTAVFATMTTISPLLSACVTSLTVKVSSIPPSPPQKKKKNPFSAVQVTPVALRLRSLQTQAKPVNYYTLEPDPIHRSTCWKRYNSSKYKE